MKRNNRKYIKHKDLIELAQPFCNNAGLVVKRIPEELMSQLRRRRLVKCGGDLLKPNVVGLQSRWWLLTCPEDARRIERALQTLRNQKGMQPCET